MKKQRKIRKVKRDIASSPTVTSNLVNDVSIKQFALRMSEVLSALASSSGN